MRRRGEEKGIDQRILGGSDFVSKVLKGPEDRQLRHLSHTRAGLTIDEIIDEECRNRGRRSQELKGGSKRRKVSEARSEIGLRGREEFGLSSAEIARHVGMNTSGIIPAIERIEEQRGYR